MPIYEYECTVCRKRFTRVSPIKKAGESRPSCSNCGSKEVRHVFTPFYAKTIRKS